MDYTAVARKRKILSIICLSTILIFSLSTSRCEAFTTTTRPPRSPRHPISICAVKGEPKANGVSKVSIDPIQNHTIEQSSKNQTNSSSVDEKVRTESIYPSTKLEKVPDRKIDLMFCDGVQCKESIRQRVIGKHNQIVLQGPATGQVAYQWNQQAQPRSPAGERAATTISSVLLLVRPNDTDLIKKTADVVPKLTHMGVKVLLAPELAAKLKYYYGVDDERIHLFEGDDSETQDRKDRRVDDSEGEWVQDMVLEPFPDLVCTLGGDGLLIHASMMFPGPVPPIMAIAGGSLGFLTPFAEHEMEDAIRIALGMGQEGGKEILKSEAAEEEINIFPPNMEHSYDHPHLLDTARASFGMGDLICMTIRMRLDCRIVNPEGLVRCRFNVLNEVVIDRGSSPYLAALECFCDDVHLTTVQADGVVFATPTGSTAYSMSAGGSVVHPAVPSILVTPICPHVLSFRSMVFPDHVVLRCYVPDDARATASVAFDGKHRRELQRGDSVQIQMSNYPVPTINRGDHSSDWLESLKRSFNFNRRPRQRPL